MNSCTKLRFEFLEDRLTPAGQLDAAFGTAGIEQFTLAQLQDVAVMPDGRIVGIGYDASSDGWSLMRFATDGTPDAGFGTSGQVTFPNVTTFNFDVVAAADNSVYVAWDDSTSGYHVAHIIGNGTFDPDYGTGGIATISGVPNSFQPSLVVKPDGKAVLVTDFTNDPLIVGQPPRYYSLLLLGFTSNGQPDAGFGTNGVAVLSNPASTVLSMQADSAALQPDGSIVVAGTGSPTARGVRPQEYFPAVYRVTPDGRFDTTFGFQGVVLMPVTNSGSFTHVLDSVRVLADGRIVAGGSAGTFGGPGSFGIGLRLTSAGQPDTTYDGDGRTTNGPAGLTAIDSLGRVVTASRTPDQSTVSRLDVNGALDASFGTSGTLDLLALPGLSAINPADLRLNRIAIQPNFDVLLGGTDDATNLQTTQGMLVRLIGSNPPAGFTPTSPGTLLAGGAANGTAQLFAPNAGQFAPAGTMTAIPGFAGNVRSTTGDVNGDGTADYIVAAGPGAAPVITVYDGTNGLTIASFLAFEATFSGGSFVAAAQLDGDNRAEIVVTPDEGGGGRVVVYSIAPGGAAALRSSFFGIDDPNFRGGARIATGDVNHDGVDDLVVAAGFLGGPRTAIFNGTTVLSAPMRLVNDFFAFPGADAQSLHNGVFVAAGDVNGDGFADLVFGGGPGGAPRVLILDGALVAAGKSGEAQNNPVANFFVAGNQIDRGGVRVAVTDVDGDNRADVAAGSGVGSPAKIRIYRGTDLNGGEPANFQDIIPFNGATLASGVYVG